jgi:hypothetical protein
MSDKSIVLVLSCLPNTTYDLPIVGAYQADSSNKSNAGKVDIACAGD